MVSKLPEDIVDRSDIQRLTQEGSLAFQSPSPLYLFRKLAYLKFMLHFNEYIRLPADF